MGALLQDDGIFLIRGKGGIHCPCSLFAILLTRILIAMKPLLLAQWDLICLAGAYSTATI